ncbi:hypothetical protein [Chlorogloea sp. CCALA 695]|uniref:hypothetical protein n=1 Tax=Chlorogloea sp. CCALA 695 TaxID=2107693 RepID=UPI000D0766E1|nr:hypothetical protein [Chlorogloea sp. CCALA 695]PSB29497.1 hypothetical protein C7B70_18385 [Chlorogloea sp. CCALA 695]
MNFRIKRRRFGQLTIVSAATTLLAKLESKVFAQQLSEQLYGVILTPASKAITEDSVDATSANTTPAIIIYSIDLATLATAEEALVANISALTVGNQQETTETVAKALLVKKPSERITALTVLSDNTFVIAATAATKQGTFSRLLFTEPATKSRVKAKKGLKVKKTKNKKYSTVESLVVVTTNDKKGDQILGVISLAEGGPPFELAFINPTSGQVDASNQLGLPQILPNQRLSNLTQSPDGTIYATRCDAEGVPLLVKLDLANKSQITGKGKIIRLVNLSFNNKPLENDLVSLAFSSAGQLFALADPNNEKTNSLFIVDVKTGELKFLRKFAVDKITFART